MTKRIFFAALLICLVFGTAAAQRARDHIAQGREHLQAQRFEQAIESFQAALALEPRNRDAPPLLQQAQQGLTTRLFNEAERLRRENKFEEAIALYDRALQAAPPDFAIRNIQNGKTQAQEGLKRQIQRQREERVAQIYNEAERLRRANNFEEAIAMYDQALEAAPQGFNTRNIQSGKSQAQDAITRQQAQQRAEQSRQTMQKGRELITANSIAEAKTEYENAVSIGGLDRYETNEAQRIITDLQNIITKMESYNRPLQDSDFEIEQSGNTVIIKNYKGIERVEMSSITVYDQNRGRSVPIQVSIGITNVVIPERLFGLQVTGIAKDAFENKGITGFTIPNNITEINFSLANNRLERIVIHNRITRIGDYYVDRYSDKGLFSGNPLTEITIPDSVTYIGSRAFQGCRLTSVTIGNSVNTIGESAFENNRLTSVTFGRSVNRIRSRAFAGNQLTAITLPASIKIIESGAFQNNQIQSVNLPNGIEIIGTEAFMNNPLTELVVPASLATMGRYQNIPTSEQINRMTFSPDARFAFVEQFRKLGDGGHPRIGVFWREVTAYEGSYRSGYFSWFKGNEAFPASLTRITMPANMHDDNLLGFENTAFVNFYKSQNKTAGVYVQNGPVWSRQ